MERNYKQVLVFSFEVNKKLFLHYHYHHHYHQDHHPYHQPSSYQVGSNETPTDNQHLPQFTWLDNVFEI